MMVRAKKILSFLLVALFISYYASTHFFYHTHHYTWGAIAHSHPYTSEMHTHSAGTLQLINSLTTLLFVGGTAVFCTMLLRVSKVRFSALETRHDTSLHIGSIQLRAPPAMV